MVEYHGTVPFSVDPVSKVPVVSVVSTVPVVPVVSKVPVVPVVPVVKHFVDARKKRMRLSIASIASL